MADYNLKALFTDLSRQISRFDVDVSGRMDNLSPRMENLSGRVDHLSDQITLLSHTIAAPDTMRMNHVYQAASQLIHNNVAVRPGDTLTFSHNPAAAGGPVPVPGRRNIRRNVRARIN